MIVRVLSGIVVLILSAVYIASMMRKEEEEEEPVIQYSNHLRELIKAMHDTAEQIDLVREMKININTADAPIHGDALRSMDIYWDWCGRMEQQATFPITKGTPTAEAMRHLADVREEELVRKLTRQIMALPRLENYDKH